MAQLIVRFDMRAPDFGAPRGRLFAAALEICEWADRQGLHMVQLSEHHGSEDGYNPSPLILASAIAARTQQLKLHTGALILTLHDPLRVAEDAAVLDHISNGRLSLTVGAGYVPSEFEMFGVDLKDRGRLMEDGVQAIRQAWTGEPFEFRGRHCQVTPRPQQEPGPPIYMGGSSKVAARRAARLGDGFITHLPDLYAAFEDEAARLGKRVLPFQKAGPGFIYVSEDPERDWQVIAPHALYETNAYGRWAVEAGVTSLYKPYENAQSLWESGDYAVLTPDQCIDFIASLDRFSGFNLHPLMGGLDPEFSWRGLELFANKVLPVVRERGLV